ncbi:MAG: SapC family protein, partial [Brevundimonas sp.]|uniref:SapC family protein n=1 Tax=Brevundimonas sp. TaxID=1871086 RepID=UPI001A30DAB1
DKLKALPADKLVELRDNGALGQIYAHLVSLLGWDRLIALAFDKAAKDQLAAGNA